MKYIVTQKEPSWGLRDVLILLNLVPGSSLILASFLIGKELYPVFYEISVRSAAKKFRACLYDPVANYTCLFPKQFDVFLQIANHMRDYMDVLAQLIGLPRLTGLARLLYKLYVFSTLRLHDSARLAGPARFGEISL